MTYKFVTREDLKDILFILSAIKADDGLEDRIELVEKLFAERDANNRVAFNYARKLPENAEIFGADLRNQIDAEAARILESTASRDSLAERSQALEKGESKIYESKGNCSCCNPRKEKK